MAKLFTEESFTTEVLESKLPVLVDFYADWCGPCKRMAPIIEELAAEYEGRACIGKLNVDNAPEISKQYRIMSIPALLFFKNGQVADSIVGAVTKEVLVSKLDALK